jgi:hypothetical protein
MLKPFLAWVVDDKQSFSVVEKRSFKKCAQVIRRNHELPVVGLSEERWCMSSRVR